MNICNICMTILVKEWWVKERKIICIEGTWLWGITSFWKSGTSWSTGEKRKLNGIKERFVPLQAWDKCTQSWARDHSGMGNQNTWCTLHTRRICCIGLAVFHASSTQGWPESYASATFGLCCYAGVDRYERFWTSCTQFWKRNKL